MTYKETESRGRASIVIPASLTFEHVVRRYGTRNAVDDVSFDVKPGEVLCLLGPSGCGKSTLLRLIAGIDDPTSGRILLDGQEISGPTRTMPPESRGIGLVFQDYALFPHLDALQNVMFGLDALGRDQRRRVAEGALRRVGLSHQMHAFPDALSGGEQQRVALARAIVPRPRVLLMDEPFSNLDKRMRDTVRDDTVALLRETGATSIIVTHDPEEAMRIADRIALMRDGKLMQIGKSRDLYTDPVDLLAARFFCEINEVPGVVRGNQVETPLGRFPAESLAETFPEGSAAVVCLRPFGVQLVAAGMGIPARVISRRFNMQIDIFELAVQGLDQPLLARIRHAPPFERGDEVGVQIDPAEVLVFPVVNT